ncbi:MAG: hypothetical protein AAGM67_09285 [Bacteroidota bacterium]
MHRLLFISVIALGLLIEACGGEQPAPDCIVGLLPADGEFVDADFMQTVLPASRDLRQAYRYQDGGDSYYELVPNARDGFTELYDEACTFICNPNGGVGGKGAGNCPHWVSELGERELIWEKN